MSQKRAIFSVLLDEGACASVAHASGLIVGLPSQSQSSDLLLSPRVNQMLQFQGHDGGDEFSVQSVTEAAVMLGARFINSKDALHEFGRQISQ